MAALGAGFPTAPLVDPDTGNVTEAWRAFLLALYARTGGAPGTSAASLSGLISAEAASRANADTALSASIAAEATARAGAITVEAAQRAAGDTALSVQIAATLGSTPVSTLAQIWFLG